MIIVDTSVWIDFLRGDEDIKHLFTRILKKRYVISLSAVFGELIQGVRNNREMEIILGFWHNLPKIDEQNLFVEAGHLSNEHGLILKGVGLIDYYILAAALQTNAEIWTLDRKLNQTIDSIQQNEFELTGFGSYLMKLNLSGHNYLAEFYRLKFLLQWL